MKCKFLFVILLLYMSLIFYLSSEPAYISHNRNRKIIETVKVTTGKDIEKKIGKERLDFYVRKNAHFFLFMFLGCLTYIYTSHTKIKNKFLIAFLFCFLYAVSDEVHQYFVPGRGPGVKDVLIDSTGAFIGISLMKIINWKSKNIMVK